MRGGARTVRRAGSRRARTVRDGASRVCATRGRPLLRGGAGSDPASEQVSGLDAAGCRARLRGRGLERTETSSRAVGTDGAFRVTRRSGVEVGLSLIHI